MDDLFVCATSVPILKSVVSQLASIFEIDDKGAPETYVGLHIKRSGRTLLLSQPLHVNSLLESAGLLESRSCQIPIDTAIQCASDTDTILDARSMRAQVGSLLYIANASRPDLAYAVGQLGSIQARPTATHYAALRHVLRYLSGTRHLSLQYQPSTSSQLEITGYADADFATDQTSRRSISGFTVFLGPHLVSWRSKRQSCVATSTAHAEIIALHALVTEVIYIREILRTMGVTTPVPVIYEDNRAVLAHLHNNGSTAALKKHIDVRIKSLRETVSSGSVVVKYIESAKNIADIFTKVVPPQHFVELRSSLGLTQQH